MFTCTGAVKDNTAKVLETEKQIKYKIELKKNYQKKKLNRCRG